MLVSVGGWAVAYLIDERGGGVSVGYVESAFWAGLTLSRVLLGKFNLYIGEKRVVFLYLGVALGLELVVWFAKRLIADAVAFTLIGFVLGPFFPIAISVTTKALPKSLHTGATGLIAGLGASGA